jgi:hypothetical protein
MHGICWYHFAKLRISCGILWYHVGITIGIPQSGHDTTKYRMKYAQTAKRYMRNTTNIFGILVGYQKIPFQDTT